MSGVISFLTGHGGGAKRSEAISRRKLLTVEFVEARDLYDVDKVKFKTENFIFPLLQVMLIAHDRFDYFRLVERWL